MVTTRTRHNGLSNRLWNWTKRFLLPLILSISRFLLTPWISNVQEKINQAGLMKNILAGDLDNSNSGPLPRPDSEWLPWPRFKYSRGNRGRRRSLLSHFDVQVYFFITTKYILGRYITIYKQWKLCPWLQLWCTAPDLDECKPPTRQLSLQGDPAAA